MERFCLNLIVQKRWVSIKTTCRTTYRSAVAPNGDIYVADRLCSQFVIQYTSKGEYIRHFGGKGIKTRSLTRPMVSPLTCATRTKPTLLITSRGHNSFKRFTLDGQYLSTIFLPGAFVCRPVFDGENIYAGVCWSAVAILKSNR